jgi:four helix bundle protein
MTFANMKDYKQLKVWNESMKLVSAIYLLTKTFPSEERFGLVTQMQRSAVSIPSNIAESVSRKSDREKVRFLEYSLGSIFELETQMLICVNVGILDEADIRQILVLQTNIQKSLNALQRYLLESAKNS